MTTSPIRVGLVGNPNCGKTTLFNALTGARQSVGNWPGVTVERRTGRYDDGAPVEVIDLPGVYTLESLPGTDGVDERIARDAVLNDEVDLIVNVINGANLERSFYLTAQLLEMRVPMVVAVNMVDVAKRQGISLDIEILATRLGCPVVAMVANRSEGLKTLKAAIVETANGAKLPAAPEYGPELRQAIASLQPLTGAVDTDRNIHPDWAAIKLLERDAAAAGGLNDQAAEQVAQIISQLESAVGEEADTVIADRRFGFAHELAGSAAKNVAAAGRSVTDRLDKMVLNRWLGLPIFLALIYAMFMLTINVGGAFIDFFDLAAAALFVDGAGAVLTSLGAPDWLRVILAQGLGGGIQVVATFIPIIGILFLCLSILEDSGYMARAAFLMDRYMRVIGLPGKAFVPLIVGFGCNVPAIMATRTLEQQRDRIMSVLMTPFMSCGARLAVYALFTAAFFPVGGQNIVFALYLIGIAVAILTGFLLKSTLLKGETSAFMMELPPYHMPTLRGVTLHTWSRLKSFIVDAGKIIIIVVMALSFLNSIGADGSFGNDDSDKSVLSEIGKAIVPVFQPMGIEEENWPATVGIFTGVFAKEAVVGTLDALYSSIGQGASDEAAPEFDLWGQLSAAFATIPENLAAISDLIADPLGLGATDNSEVAKGTFQAMADRFDGAIGAFAYLLFILLYFPCVAALGAVKREVGPRWATFAALWTTGIAYVVAVGFYQVATLDRHPSQSLAWIIGLSAAMVATVLVMRLIGRKTHATNPVIAT